MPTIRHFLKDGTQVDSVEGRVVRHEDCPSVYHALDKLNERLSNNRPIHSKEAKQNGEHDND